MTAVLMMFTIQCMLGAFDNLWHHELQADLPHEPSARGELALHTARELLYALIFSSIAWNRWEGAWTYVLIGILAIEIVVTVWDFVVEDRTRRLPPFERVLHTVLALNYGALLALWAPELMRWADAPTGFGAADYGVWSWLLTIFGFGVFLWGLRDLFAVARLGVPEWQRNPIRAGSSSAPRVVLVTGGTGFVGRALTRALVERGDHVIVLSRRVARARDLFGPCVEVCGALSEIEAHRRIDAIVNLAGEPIVGRLWTKAQRGRLIGSRVGTTMQLVELMARLDRKPQVLVNGSAIGYYGDRGDQILDETSAPRVCFLSQLCQDWEAAAAQAEKHGVRVVCMRIGLVMGAGGGVLLPLKLATMLGGGTVLGDGRQWQSWIHLGDLVRMIEFAIERKDLHGAVNAVAPVAIDQRGFSQVLSRQLRRPVLLRMPAVLLRALTGEMADLFLISQRVLPRRMMDAGFAFLYAELPTALGDILGNGKQARFQPSAVYVNEECPVCRTEMAWCESAARRVNLPLEFKPLEARAADLIRYGLTKEDITRRLFVQMADGRVRSGMDAILAIWAELPRVRWVATTLALPGFYQICTMSYDLICAPLLTWWSAKPALKVETVHFPRGRNI